MRAHFPQAPSCLACGVVLAACFHHAAAQCVPLVSGEVKYKVGLPSSGWAPLDVVAALVEQCGELSFDWLVVNMTADAGDPDLNVSLKLSWRDYINTSAGNLEELFNLPPITPEISAAPCIELMGEPIASVSGAYSLYSFHIGGGGPLTKQVKMNFTFCDTIRVTSPIPTTLEVPIHIDGDVLAAESFGDPNATKATAMLELSGLVAGTAVGPFKIEVESVTVFPEQDAINQTQIVSISVPSGVTEFDVTLTGKAEAEATAKSTGLWGSIAGAATSAVSFPQTLRISNFTGPGGGPLPDGILVESLGAGFRYVGPLGAAFAPCDANCDGSLNAFDIQPFRELLIGSGSPCAAGTGDVNRDGSVNAQDIQPFRDALLLGGC